MEVNFVPLGRILAQHQMLWLKKIWRLIANILEGRNRFTRSVAITNSEFQNVEQE